MKKGEKSDNLFPFHSLAAYVCTFILCIYKVCIISLSLSLSFLSTAKFFIVFYRFVMLLCCSGLEIIVQFPKNKISIIQHDKRHLHATLINVLKMTSRERERGEKRRDSSSSKKKLLFSLFLSVFLQEYFVKNTSKKCEYFA